MLEVLSAAHNAGKDTLDRTPEMLPVLRDAGAVDAGGAGFLLLAHNLHLLHQQQGNHENRPEGPNQ